MPSKPDPEGLCQKLITLKTVIIKLQYSYLLTPKGVAEKTKLTIMFLKVKTEEYEALKKEVEKLTNAETGK